MKTKKTKVERRLAVVKDAIKQLKGKAFYAKTGSVITIHNEALRIYNNPGNAEVKPILTKLLKSKPERVCSVCARGALLLSTIHKENTFTFSKLDDSDCGSFHADSIVDKRLLHLFSAKQIALIEEAFEVGYEEDYIGEEKVFNTILSIKEAHPAHIFHDKYQSSDNQRLLAILENIVKNKGLFKPQNEGK